MLAGLRQSDGSDGFPVAAAFAERTTSVLLYIS